MTESLPKLLGGIDDVAAVCERAGLVEAPELRDARMWDEGNGRRVTVVARAWTVTVQDVATIALGKASSALLLQAIDDARGPGASPPGAETRHG